MMAEQLFTLKFSLRDFEVVQAELVRRNPDASDSGMWLGMAGELLANAVRELNAYRALYDHQKIATTDSGT